MKTINNAVLSLRPNTEWTMNNFDVENIIWHTENVKPLTKAEVDAELVRLQTEEKSKKTELLTRLGITADEAKLLLG
jgi:hypothetical protein